MEGVYPNALQLQPGFLLQSFQHAKNRPQALTPRSSSADPFGLLEKPDTAAQVAPNKQESVQNNFDTLIYRSQFERYALSLELQQAIAAGSGEDGAGAAQAQQLSFDFEAEYRSEELMVFRERAAAVAEQLEGAQQQAFQQTSRHLAARFSLSLSVSATTLRGFAGAAEGAGGDSDLIERLRSFTEQALQRADEILNRAFEMLEDFLSNPGQFAEGIGQLLQELQRLFEDFNPFGGSSGGQGAQSQSVSFRFEMQLEFEFEYSEEVVQKSDPLVFDLDGDGIELTNYRDGARFDITGDGRAVKTAFVTGGDAFLAIDRNGNGRIDSGRELFGDQNGAANGYEELRKLDSNRDGRIDASDRNFDALRLFRDDGDGITEEGELISLEEAGIVSIDLGYRNVNETAPGGNRLAQIAAFTRTDGSRGRTADALLNYLA